jgi:hypothetical protein
MSQKDRDKLLEHLLTVSSQLDDAYNITPRDKEWIAYLQELQSNIYKQIMAIPEEKE